MKVTIQSTTKLVELNGVPARIWEGYTEGGVPIHCFITRLGIDKECEALFEEESDVQPHSAPTPGVQAYDFRLII